MNIVGTALLESRNKMGVGIADKARKIELLRKEWLRHKAGDSEFAWFEDKKERSQRCQCAREWVERNHRFISE